MPSTSLATLLTVWLFISRRTGYPANPHFVPVYVCILCPGGLGSEPDRRVAQGGPVVVAEAAQMRRAPAQQDALGLSVGGDALVVNGLHTGEAVEEGCG